MPRYFLPFFTPPPIRAFSLFKLFLSSAAAVAQTLLRGVFDTRIISILFRTHARAHSHRNNNNNILDVDTYTEKRVRADVLNYIIGILLRSIRIRLYRRLSYRNAYIIMCKERISEERTSRETCKRYRYQPPSYIDRKPIYSDV